MPIPAGFVFGPFHLDLHSRQLVRDTAVVPLPQRYVALLGLLVERAGAVVTKGDLIAAAWPGQDIGDTSLTQGIRQIRRALDADSLERYVATASRVGYRFIVAVTPVFPPTSDDEIAAILAPHQAAAERRTTFEALQIDRIVGIGPDYEQIVAADAGDVAAHLGLAAVYFAQYEATRADPKPNVDALRRAVHHAREAVRLNARLADAWTILGLALDRLGERRLALAALKQAVAIEPHEWPHYLRWAWVAWGRERIRAAERLLELQPGNPMAHWLIATVHVGWNALRLAEDQVDLAIASMQRGSRGSDAFPPIAVYWLKGSLVFARGEIDEARAAFARELETCPKGHLYERETMANTCYAIGALEWRVGNRDAARDGVERAIALVSGHAMAHAGMALVTGRMRLKLPEGTRPVDAAMARAALVIDEGDTPRAARGMDEALIAAPPGHAGWVLPIEPLLNVGREPQVWGDVLAELRARAN